jgi:hypothetical protein
MKSYAGLVRGLALAVLVLAGCASSQPVAEQPRAGNICINVRQINSFEALDDRHVLIRARVSDYYLFTVGQPCSGLAFARAIVIPEPLNRVCGDGFSDLSFNLPGAGSKRCRIVKIEPVEDRRAAKALIESRRAKKIDSDRKR